MTEIPAQAALILYCHKMFKIKQTEHLFCDNCRYSKYVIRAVLWIHHRNYDYIPCVVLYLCLRWYSNLIWKKLYSKFIHLQIESLFGFCSLDFTNKLYMLNYRITDFNFEVIVYRSKVRAINVSNAISNNMPTIEHKGIKISENISKASYAKLSY